MMSDPYTDETGAPTRIMYVCELCADGAPESCGHYDLNEIAIMPNGQWICEDCYDALSPAEFGIVIGDDDFPPVFRELPKAPEYVSRARSDARVRAALDVAAETPPKLAFAGKNGYIPGAKNAAWEREIAREHHLMSIFAQKCRDAIRAIDPETIEPEKR